MSDFNVDFGIVARKNNGNLIKVTMNKFRGQLYVHIREYGVDGDDGSQFPLPKGITIPPEEVDTTIELLNEVSKKLTELDRGKNSKQLYLFSK